MKPAGPDSVARPHPLDAARGSSAPGEGDLDHPEVVPAGAGCTSFFLQQVGFDPGAPRGLSLTNGLEVFVGT